MRAALVQLEYRRQALRAELLAALGWHRESYFGLALIVLLAGVVPPLGLVPLAPLVAIFFALLLAFVGVILLVTVVLAPVSLLFF